jgi:hypothetical protein
MKASKGNSNKDISNQIQSEAKQFTKRLTFFISGLHKYLRPENQYQTQEIPVIKNSEAIDNRTEIISEFHDIYQPIHTVKNSCANSVHSQPVRDTIGKVFLTIGSRFGDEQNSLTSLKKKTNTIWRKNVEVDLALESQSLDSLKNNYQGNRMTFPNKDEDLETDHFHFSSKKKSELKENSSQKVSPHEPEKSRFSIFMQELYGPEKVEPTGSVRLKAVSIYKIRKKRFVYIIDC